MNPTRIAVIGAGHLGRIHCRLLKSCADVDLVGVIDPVEESRRRVAEEFGIRPLADYRPIASEFDAAVIAAPTTLHHRIALDLLEQGKHVLVEKPIACTTAEAADMVQAADSRGLVLQVGHVERFNPALAAAREHLAEPKYIEAARTSGFTFRSTDIGVVLDLMIHDLDIVLSLAGSEVCDVEAIGVAIMGPHEDMAQARLTFANGCVANLTASRTSFELTRRMSVFTAGGFAALDFASGNAVVVEPSTTIAEGRFDLAALSPAEREHYKQHLFEELLPMRQLSGVPCNAIAEEQHDFVRAIRTGSPVQVSGNDGLRALELAETILARIAAHRWDGHDRGRIGPLGWTGSGTASPMRKAG